MRAGLGAFQRNVLVLIVGPNLEGNWIGTCVKDLPVVGAGQAAAEQDKSGHGGPD